MINLFYLLKPVIPRKTQLELRKWLAHKKLQKAINEWPILASSTEPPIYWQGWPDQKQFAVILRHDVESQKGHDRSRELMLVEKQLGFRSAFYFVPERYKVCKTLRTDMVNEGFEIGVHGLKHDGKLYRSPDIFKKRAQKINHYLSEWNAVGFTSPASHHKLDWNYALEILYDSSTFDTDPFEPQPTNLATIFPKWIDHVEYPNEEHLSHSGYVELPYTLPQDFQSFVIMQQKNIDLWKRKVDWIAEHGGMVNVVTHPDYMSFGNDEVGIEEYPIAYYEQFLTYIKEQYADRYWHGLPRDLATFFSSNVAVRSTFTASVPLCADSVSPTGVEVVA